MANALHDQNRNPTVVLSNTVGTTPVVQTGSALTNSTPAHVATVDSNGNLVTPSPLGLSTYDYVSLTINSATETYVFKTGGSGGTTTNTIVIVYTDATRTDISTVTKT